MANEIRLSTPLLVLCAVVAAYTSMPDDQAQAKGLVVSPPGYTWNGVTPGNRTAMERKLWIVNESNRRRTYSLTAHSCRQAGLTPSDGCNDLPDSSWVQFDRRYIAIEANEPADANVYLHIPPDRANYGKRWQFYIEVREDVPQYGYIQGKPDLFALAVFLKIIVSTDQVKATADSDSFAPTTPSMTADTPTGILEAFWADPLHYGWPYCGKAKDLDCLMYGPVGPIIAPRNTEMPGKMELM
jgi:hypothetical protein